MRGRPVSLGTVSTTGSGPGAGCGLWCLVKCFFHSIPSVVTQKSQYEYVVQSPLVVEKTTCDTMLKLVYLNVQVVRDELRAVHVCTLCGVRRRPFARLQLC